LEVGGTALLALCMPKAQIQVGWQAYGPGESAWGDRLHSPPAPSNNADRISM